MFRFRSNLLRQSISTFIVHYRETTSTNRSIFSDETLKHLFPDESSLVVGKVLRDHYEELLQEKSRTHEVFEELYRNVFDAKQQKQRELMYLKGILHSRGLIEEFRGYLRGVLQSNMSAPMATKKMYIKMLEFASDPSKNLSIIIPITEEFLCCFDNHSHELSTHEQKIIFTTITHELDHLYNCLSESVHAVKIGRHDRDFVICTDTLTKQQVCLIRSIAKHFLRLQPHEIRLIQCENKQIEDMK